MAIDWKTWGPILAGAGATGVTAYMNQRNRNQDKKDAAAARAEDRADDRETNILDVAQGESMADPFRHQNAQINSLGMLDRIRNANNTRPTISVPSEMQRFVPQISGGFDYTASPDLRAAAGLLQRSVASGQGAPTMTDPANYGRTGAVNLNDPSSIGMGARPNAPAAPSAGGTGGAVPRTGTSSAPGTMSNSYFAGGVGAGADAGSESYSTNEEDMAMNLASGNPYYTNYRRRREGAGGALSSGMKYGQLGATVGSVVPGLGTAAGAVIGGIGGLIGGAFTKNAKSAMSDFYLDDAKQILRDATEEMWGEAATDEQIEEAIVGQGWQPGDRWVGQESLDYILQQWAQRAQPRAGAEEEEFTPSYSGLFA
jgi:hypothetical protein